MTVSIFKDKVVVITGARVGLDVNWLINLRSKERGYRLLLEMQRNCNSGNGMPEKG